MRAAAVERWDSERYWGRTQVPQGAPMPGALFFTTWRLMQHHAAWFLGHRVARVPTLRETIARLAAEQRAASTSQKVQISLDIRTLQARIADAQALIQRRRSRSARLRRQLATLRDWWLRVE